MTDKVMGNPCMVIQLLVLSDDVYHRNIPNIIVKTGKQTNKKEQDSPKDNKSMQALRSRSPFRYTLRTYAQNMPRVQSRCLLVIRVGVPGATCKSTAQPVKLLSKTFTRLETYEDVSQFTHLVNYRLYRISQQFSLYSIVSVFTRSSTKPYQVEEKLTCTIVLRN